MIPQMAARKAAFLFSPLYRIIIDMFGSKFDVICIGSATRDNYLRAQYKLVDWPDAPSKKAIVMPFGEKMGVDEVFSTIGGNAANAAVTFARYGFKTACLAKIGDDPAGREFTHQMEEAGVDTKLIIKTKEKPTAYSVLLLGDGERTILGYHGASDTFRMSDVGLSRLKSRWWYLSLAGESDEMFLPLLKFARENKIKVAFNPSGHHIGHKRDEILAGLKDLAFLVLNTGEAADLVGISFEKEKEVFAKLDELVPGVVAITDGPKGVKVSDGTNLYSAGIYKEKATVDRTGCGDAFGSGFAAVLAEAGEDYKNPEIIKKAIAFASATATANLEVLGATEGLLTKEGFETQDRWRGFEIKIDKI